jgi:hypothetical protein
LAALVGFHWRVYDVMGEDERGYTFTPLLLFFGLWLAFGCLLRWLWPLPVWAAIILGLVAVLSSLRAADAIFNR